MSLFYQTVNGDTRISSFVRRCICVFSRIFAERFSKVLKVGVTDARYVTLNHARPWVIHSYRNIKGRGVHKEEPDSTSPLVEEPAEKKRKSDEVCSSESSGTPTLTVEAGLPDTPHTRSETSDICDDAIHLIEAANDNNVDISHTSTPVNTVKRTTCTVPTLVSDTNVLSKSEDIVTAGDGEDDKESDMDTMSSHPSTTTQSEHTGNDHDTGVADATHVEGVGGVKTVESPHHLRKDRKRKVPGFNEESRDTHTPAAVSSTYDKVRLVIQPWLKPEGSVNKPILKMMLESVLLFLMMKPGANSAALNRRYSPYVQPMVLKNILQSSNMVKPNLIHRAGTWYPIMTWSHCSIVLASGYKQITMSDMRSTGSQILEELGCVKEEHVRKTRASLFSTVAVPTIAPEAEEGDVTVYIPTETCLFRLGQFGQEMYPNIKWPLSEEYS